MKRIGLLFAWIAIAQTAFALTLYVAPDGSDTASGKAREPVAGSSDGPLASLEGARNRIRQLRAEGLSEGVEVKIRSGNYFLSQPFVLEPQDSGTHAAPVRYAAESYRTPAFLGGRRISDWTKQDNGHYSAKLPPDSEWRFRQLFVNGQRRTRARTPNRDFYHVANRMSPDLNDPRNNRAFVFSGEDIKDWKDPGAEVIAIHSWETARLLIKSLDAANHIVEFAGSSYWPFTQWDARQRYYVENVPDALDAPGEWRLDRETKTVTYIPFPHEDMQSAEIVAPAMAQFVMFKGDPGAGTFVQNITLSGLSFQYADWDLPATGYGDPQAAYSVPGVIEMTCARHCAIEGCEISHIGTYAIRVKQGSRDNRFEQNHIHDLGAGGICIGEGSLPKGESEEVSRNLVRNNYIHDGGHVYESGIGVWIGQSPDNTVSNNEIADFGYTGVSVGWTWGYSDARAERNIIEYNHIHHLGNDLLSDMGGIYTLGFHAGSVLRYNHIHHVWAYEYGGWGIYPDEGTSHMLIENNVVHHTKTGGFHQHYGKENLVLNNIFALSMNAQIMRSRKEEHRSFRFERNIVYFDQGELLATTWGDDHFFLDHNIYWRTDGAPLDFKGASLDEWRKSKNMDWNSLVADPMFVNPDDDDYRLRPDSPALALGFKEIDLSRTGLIGPKQWRDLPERFTNHRQVWPEPPEPTELDEDFEGMSVGQAMPVGTTYGETKDATVRTTEAQAASGKRSLMFTDASGLDHEFNPHWYLDPGFRSGVARAEFDLRFEPGEIVCHEWRTDGSSYHAGPSMTINPAGELLIGGEKRAALNPDQWVHFRIECGLGQSGTGSYSVEIEPRGESPQSFSGIPCDPKFRSLRWFGLCSMAREKKAFYVDNLKLSVED